MDVIMRKLLIFNNFSRKEIVMKKFVIIVFLVLMTILNVHADNEWQVNRIAHDGNYVYIGTENVGFITIDKQNGEQTQYVHPWDDYWKGICDISFHDGKVYYVTKYYNLVSLKDGKMFDEPINVPYAAPQYFLFPRLAWAPNGVLWTYHMTNLVMQMGRVTFLGKEEPEPEGGPHFICEEVMSCIAVDDEGVVWFGCCGKCSAYCIGRFSIDRGFSFPIREARSSKFGRAIRAVIIDAQNNKWFTSDTGLVLYDQSEKLTLYELKGAKYDLVQLEDGRFLVPNDKDLYLFKDKEFSLLCDNAAGKTILCVDAVGDTYYFGTEDGLFKLEGGKVTQIPLLSQTVDVGEPVSVQQTKVSQRTFDLQGRQVMGETDAESEKESLPKGIYVNKGKKYVAK